MMPVSPGSELFTTPLQEMDSEQATVNEVFRAILPGGENVWLGSRPLNRQEPSRPNLYSTEEDGSEIDPNEPPSSIDTDEDESNSDVDGSDQVSLTGKIRRSRNRFVCLYCKRQFANHSDCHTHEGREHTGVKSHACRVEGCTERFFGAQLRLRHEKREHQYYHPPNTSHKK